MERDSRDETGTLPQHAGSLIVRFDERPRHRWPADALSRLEGLIPRRWRRWVVIQGCRFWLPG